MKCDHCDNEATVHEVTVAGGVPHEKHLCEACARDAGLVVASQLPISQLLTHAVVQKASARVVGPGVSSGCSECGTTFGEFKESGLLGCPACYRVFEKQISPLLDRAHEGATHHVGKVPRRALWASRSGGDGGGAIESVLGPAEERARRGRLLRQQMEAAIAAEEYERAARLRDDLRRLTELGQAAGEDANGDES